MSCVYSIIYGEREQKQGKKNEGKYFLLQDEIEYFVVRFTSYFS